MNENLKDAVDHWLQGQVNTCVAGLISRIERLETTVAGLQRRGEKPVQPKHRTLKLVELRLLAHHGYIACPRNPIWSNAEADAYDKLLSLKLIEQLPCDQTLYQTTAKGDAYLAVLQVVPIQEDV